MNTDLNDFILSAHRDIQDEYQRILKRVKEDPGTAGDQGEENWATLLRNWLPPTFQIVTKGRIIGFEGEPSPQIDVLVLRPEYPKKLLDKKLYLADGVLAAFECKIIFKVKHLEKAIQTSKAIKNLFIPRSESPYKQLHAPIVYGLLAHSHNLKKTKKENGKVILENLIKYDNVIVEHPREMIDIVCIADLATWSCSRWYHGPIDHKYSSTFYYTFMPKDHDMVQVTSIGSFISQLLQKIAWEYEPLRGISLHFGLSGIAGSGIGKNQRKWEHTTIYNDLEKYATNNLHRDRFWDEWRPMF